ncbi:MAG: ferrochelatase [Chloroflexi bacterium]|nr:ferrochelatase [Chloroflexota bacterium]
MLEVGFIRLGQRGKHGIAVDFRGPERDAPEQAGQQNQRSRDKARQQQQKKHLEREIAALPLPPDMFVITYHGIPNRYVTTGDPYREHCEHTAGLLADAMAWRDDQWTVSFQSRFGPEAWMQPYTEDVLEALHHRGVRRPLVFAPGFVTDCLETLDELGNEGREQFAEGGGNAGFFHLAPCLNANPGFMDALAEIVQSNASGWANVEEGRRPSKDASTALESF